jgi:hypothetical protein
MASGLRPKLLKARVPCDDDEFLSWHFPTGERRDTARRLWRLLTDLLCLDLRGLHPDDDLSSLVGEGGNDSLIPIEVAVALAEDSDAIVRATDGALGSFREWVERMTRDEARPR